jgi:hypothetical protein
MCFPDSWVFSGFFNDFSPFLFSRTPGTPVEGLRASAFVGTLTPANDVTPTG